MSLRIIPASAPIEVKTIVLLIYGPPGVGKTTLGFSAENPLLLDTDTGAHRASGRKDIVPVGSWADIVGITADNVKPYKTLVLDTVGRALDLLGLEIARDPKLRQRTGGLTQSGYGTLKTQFIAFLNLMRSFGVDIVLIAHGSEQQQGDEVIERIDAVGGSKQEVYRCSDAIGRLAVQGGKRVLSFSPTDTRFGKDPARLGSIAVPDFGAEPQFLGGVIRDIKSSLNQQSAQQTEAAAQVKKFAEAFAAAETPEQWTALIKLANGDRAQKRTIHNAATSRGLVYDQKLKAYVDPSAPAKVNADDDSLPY